MTADLEDLMYIGMRTLLGDAYSRRELRSFASRAVASKQGFAEEWQSAAMHPTLRVEGESRLGGGSIFALPHVGPYHRVPLHLAERGIPAVLLLDGENFEREQRRMTMWMERFAGSSAVAIRFLNVHETTTVWRAARALHDGFAVVIYSDGNAGIDAGRDAASTMIRWRGRHLRVRRGIGQLSGHARVPVVPMAIERHEDGDVLTVHEPLMRDAEEALDAYAQRVMQHCYDHLGAIVEHDPAAWEEWYHLARWYVPPRCERPLSTPTHVRPDLDNIDLVELESGQVVTNVRTGVSLHATPVVLRCLTEDDGLAFSAAEALAGSEVVAELIAHGFLLPEARCAPR